MKDSLGRNLPDDYQVVFVTRPSREALEALVIQHNWELFPIPNGVNEEGQPVIDSPDDLPVFGIGPRH
jgi:hypothetical protein